VNLILLLKINVFDWQKMASFKKPDFYILKKIFFVTILSNNNLAKFSCQIIATLFGGGPMCDVYLKS